MNEIYFSHYIGNICLHIVLHILNISQKFTLCLPLYIVELGIQDTWTHEYKVNYKVKQFTKLLGKAN